MDIEVARVVAERYSRRLLDIAGVVGVATGVMWTVGAPVPCVKVYLAEALPRGPLAEGMIPTQLDGVPVDAVVSGEMRAVKSG